MCDVRNKAPPINTSPLEHPPHIRHTLHTTPHVQPLDELRKVVTPYYLDIMSRSNKTFWHRRVRVAWLHLCWAFVCSWLLLGGSE